MRDLEGLLVVSVEQAVAAPYAASRLADAGARVIKVERPEGDFARGYDRMVHGQSAYFVWLNRGKESVRLDLQTPRDRAMLGAMIAKADVFIQNLAPGAMARLGFGAAEIRARRPSLITCSISGYGEEGPRAHLKAYDLLIQAESGLAAITGGPEGPARVGVSVCDIAAGMTAHAAILQALIGRGRTGQGRAIEVSLFHAVADWMNVPYLQSEYGGRAPGARGAAPPHHRPYGVFECVDGALLISIQNEREWRALCALVLDDPGLADDPRFADNSARLANRPALDGLVADRFALERREALAERLETARIAYGRLSSVADFAAHPQNRFIEVRTEGGPVRLVAPGAVIAGEGLPALGPVPALGAQDEALRAEFAP
jgi:crotonobetainyl-CoA:carnitine CoA-transferase CaiB-like acyl-CoA transferase